VTAPREWTLPLAFTKPLSLNDRMHWQVKRKHTSAWRGHARDLALAAGIPLLERFTAVLHYQPRDNRRRDTDHLIAALKPGRMWLVVRDLSDEPGVQAALDLTTEGNH
jgi:hypothetical protein